MVDVSRNHARHYCFPSGFGGCLLFLAGVSGLFAEQAVPNPRQGTVSPSGAFMPKNQGAEIPEREAREVEKKLRDECRVEADADGVIHWGTLRIDTRAKSVTLPATVNQSEGVVEYALVHEKGKVHEALFATKISARHLQAALLLLGAKSVPLDSGESETQTIHPGSGIEIRVEWETNGPVANHPLESLLVSAADPSVPGGEPLANGAWFFNGSRITATGFAADQSGSIISLVADPVAVVNNPRPGRLNDKLHLPRTALLPKKGQPVRLILSPAPRSNTKSP
jgi:hypothetical protein